MCSLNLKREKEHKNEILTLKLEWGKMTKWEIWSSEMGIVVQIQVIWGETLLKKKLRLRSVGGRGVKKKGSGR